MKKFFLIPLLSVLCTAMAFATVRKAGTPAELISALEAAVNGDEIQLTADINLGYTADTRINVTKSITINGQGHTLTGAAPRPDSNSSWGTILVNYGGTDDIDVAFVDINIINAYTESQYVQCVNARQHVASLSFDNVTMDITGSKKANSNPIQLGGSGFEPTVTLNNCRLLGKNDDYAFYTWVPVELHATNTTFSGYCGIYFKNGSRGSVVDAENCNFECPNVHSGKSNAFSCFPLEDDGITINLHNCGMNIEQVGDQNQALVTVNNNSRSRKELPVYITISGDNSHFNTKGGMNKTIQNLWIQGYNQDNQLVIVQEEFPEIVFVLEGGTYSVNPTKDMLYYGSWVKDEETGEYTGSINVWGPTIPDGYEIAEVNQGGITLYRVVKSAAEKTPGVLYDLNDKVAGEGVAEGNNPVSSFDLSTGSEMELNQETTTAGYVQVKDNEDTSDATIIKVGKVENPGTSSETKVDQTLVINNGLDVQGDSKVEVQAGSALIIGEGGITTEDPENIVIGADKEGAASLLLDPAITVNQTPELTVKMTAQNVGKMNKISGSGVNYFWHRFALPVDKVQAGDGSWAKDGHNYGTLLYTWDYTKNDWASLTNLNQLKPFVGYTLSVEELAANPSELKNAGYIFKGKLTGNVNSTLEFSRQGYNFFGNSYTGYISVLKLVDELLGNGDIDGTVWMWDAELQQYEDVPLNDLRNNPTAPRYTGSNAWRAEVAPMQTFILRLMTENTDATADINYASAVWGNPRYAAATGITPSPAPARRVASTNDAYVRIIVSAANGKKDAVKFCEDANLSDAYDKGYDGAKYMNERSVNVYATVNGENYGTVATDNIEGKMLTINTTDEISYTMSFSDIEGDKYAVRDNVTGAIVAIEKGATYDFVAQPNSTVEGRFEIVNRYEAPTALENTEIKANVKGIYSITGLYLGEDFNALPAGVYVVNGVKIVK